MKLHYLLNTIKSIFFSFTCLSTQVSFAQNIDSLKSNYLEKYNHIQNMEQLEVFQLKLDSLRKGNKEKVTILHIGDSHLQGDYNSRTIRYKLQAFYGNRGRGLTFPYSLAKTYGPTDYWAESKSYWDLAKMFPGEKNIPVGLAGYTISTAEKSAFKQTFRYNPNIKWGAYANIRELPNSKFNLATILLSYSGSVQLKIYSNDLNSERDSTLHYLPYASVNKDTILKVTFSRMVDELFFSIQSKDTNSFRFNLHGIIVENSLQTGLLYHVAGVGACQLSDFLNASKFYQNTISLNPDLIIFSLGANESITRNFDTAKYLKQFTKLLSDLRHDIPGVNFIIQTPPDIIFKKRSPISIDKINSTLKFISHSQNTGLWDFNTVMGALGSNQHWFNRGLISKDRIHFKPTGYHLAGLLFLDAFNKSFITDENQRLNTNELASYFDLFKPSNLSDSISNATINTPQYSKINKSTTKIKEFKTPKNYIVKKGDTIYSIAKRYKLTTQDLLKINHLSSKSIIRPGQILKLY
jgi:hypothetical protein